MFQTEPKVLEAVVPLARSRESIDVQVVDTSFGRIAGYTQYDGDRVTRVVVPRAESAQDRVVRMHELLHAKHSPIKHRLPKGCTDLAYQIYEDSRVHGVYWPAHLPTSRDREISRCELAVALRDLRTLDHRESIPRDQWDHSVLVAIRSLTIIYRHLGNMPCVPASAYRRREKMLKRINRLRSRVNRYFPLDDTRNVMSRIVNTRIEIKPTERTRLIRAVQALLIGGSPEPLPILQDQGIPNPEPEDRKPSKSKKLGIEMAVYEPTRSVPCLPASKREKRYSPNGGRLNVAGIPRFITQWDSRRLFRTTPQRQSWTGTVLIDGSGSMGVDSARLARLCAAIPGATVAYYSGDKSIQWKHPNPIYDDIEGTLVVFARNGTRIDATETPCHSADNEVDAAAIEWLVQQPGPWVLVTDLRFCGGRDGQVQRAHNLLKCYPAIKVIKSIADAWSDLVGTTEPRS